MVSEQHSCLTVFLHFRHDKIALLDGFLKPEMPAMSTLVSTTPRDFCFLAFRDNGNLRRSSFLTVGANCPQDFLVRHFADLFSRLGQRLQKLLLPAPAFAAARQIPVQVSPYHLLLELFSECTERHAALYGVLLGCKPAFKEDILRIV